jgi:hypothetical protein
MKALKIILALIVVTWLIVGTVTLIPHATAHKTSSLGYKALCPFAPYSTIISFAAAAIFYFALRKLDV